MVDRHEIIGGEFDLDLQSLRYKRGNSGQLTNTYKYSSGRSALYYILLDIKAKYNISKIMLPDYLCSSVVIAVEKAEMEIVFYELNENLEIDENVFVNYYSENNAVLIINYFGLQYISKQVTYVRKLNSKAVVIEDDVQSYYEFVKDLNGVDYKFTSLRKTFAIPDGGLVKTSGELNEPQQINRFHQYKLAGSILKSLRKPEYYDDEVYLSMFENGETLIDADITKGMSNIAMDIISKTDIERLASIRSRNARFIANGLDSLGIKIILPIPEEKTPLFVPIYLDDRDRVRKYLFQHNVFCPVHWPLEGIKVKKGAELADHELSIIVDQRYTNKDMYYMLDLLEKALKW